MTSSLPMNRRRLLTLSAGAAVTGLLGGSLTGCTPAANDRQLQFASLEEALAELARLDPAAALPPATAWNWAQTLHHCAQSIEYSMTGFPEPKSALFQRTVGAAAFQVFSARGRMSHNLAEPIPGAPALPADADVAQAVQRLQQAVTGFRQWSGALQPHFAYGALDKSEYEQAHAMHLANHFSAFERVG